MYRGRFLSAEGTSAPEATGKPPLDSCAPIAREGSRRVSVVLYSVAIQPAGAGGGGESTGNFIITHSHMNMVSLSLQGGDFDAVMESAAVKLGKVVAPLFAPFRYW